MSDWTWSDLSPAPPSRTIVAQRHSTGSVLTFHTDDGEMWTASVVRARGMEAVTEPIEWDEIMRHKEQVER